MTSVWRRGLPRWARVCCGIGAVLVGITGTAVVGAHAAVRAATSTVQVVPLLGAAQPVKEREHAEIKGAKNILLVGLDTRVSWTSTDMPSRADSIILLHIPADHSTAYLISLPRDSYVAIPEYDNGAHHYPGGHNKINAAFAFGSMGLTGDAATSHGFELLALTVKKLTGITPDAAGIVDFAGFTQVMQVLKTICMNVDEKVTSIHMGHDKDGKLAIPYTTNGAGQNPRRVRGVTPNVYEKGYHCFTPAEALDFSRQRDLLENKDGDYGRQRHQQQLLKAILTQSIKQGLDSPTKLPSILSSIGKTMTVDDGGIALDDWVFALRNINPSSMVTLKTNGGQYNSRNISGVGSAEILDATTKEMLKAAKNDDLATFAQKNPTWVIAN